MIILLIKYKMWRSILIPHFHSSERNHSHVSFKHLLIFLVFLLLLMFLNMVFNPLPFNSLNSTHPFPLYSFHFYLSYLHLHSHFLWLQPLWCISRILVNIKALVVKLKCENHTQISSNFICRSTAKELCLLSLCAQSCQWDTAKRRCQGALPFITLKGLCPFHLAHKYLKTN